MTKKPEKIDLRLPAVIVAAAIALACGVANAPEDHAETDAAAEKTAAAAPEPAPEPEPPPAPEPEPKPTEPTEPTRSSAPSYEQADPSQFRNRWVEGKTGDLLLGLDNGEYEPYRPAFVERVQRALIDKGFYDGPVMGKLDQATMEAVAAFQRENGVQASGVPSPETRRVLFAEDMS